MVKYKLTYFDITWLGEPVRFMLSYMGKEFEDCRIAKSSEEWPEMKKKIPFGRIPTLEIDGKLIYQSTAICRYLAVEAGLNGKNDWENLQIDMIIGTLFDMLSEFSTHYFETDPEQREKKRLKFINETIPYYYKQYEEIIKNNGGFLANNALSWADLFLTAITEAIDESLQCKVLEKYPDFKALTEKVRSIPRIKKWIESRPKK